VFGDHKTPSGQDPVGPSTHEAGLISGSGQRSSSEVPADPSLLLDEVSVEASPVDDEGSAAVIELVGVP
jgi:hypothetical protein